MGCFTLQGMEFARNGKCKETVLQIQVTFFNMVNVG